MDLTPEFATSEDPDHTNQEDDDPSTKDSASEDDKDDETSDESLENADEYLPGLRKVSLERPRKRRRLVLTMSKASDRRPVSKTHMGVREMTNSLEDYKKASRLEDDEEPTAMFVKKEVWEINEPAKTAKIQQLPVETAVQATKTAPSAAESSENAVELGFQLQEVKLKLEEVELKRAKLSLERLLQALEKRE